MTALELERVRPLLEAEVQRLIDLLDQIDVDHDLEEGADLEEDTADLEPLHGAPERQAGSWKGIDASFGCDDGEELELGWTEQEARWNRYSGAGADVYEPSLGSNNGINQARWSNGGTDDLEEEFDGRELAEDTDASEDEMISWHSFTRSERQAINAAKASLNEIVQRRREGNPIDR